MTSHYLRGLEASMMMVTLWLQTAAAVCPSTLGHSVVAATEMPTSTSNSSSSVDASAGLRIGEGSTQSDEGEGSEKSHRKDAVQKSARHIMHFSDVHLNISESLNPSDYTRIRFQYGDDAPLTLLTSALEYAKQVLPNPDFFLYTGDHVVHGDKLPDTYVAEAVKTNIETMAQYYSKATDTTLGITAIMGNADTSPDYTMDVTDPETEVNPRITLISGAWKDTLTKSNLDAFNHYGYLPYDVDKNLVVLSLNTLPYSPSHFPDTSGMPDPFEQFAWLNSSLLKLQQEDRFAYVVGHIPPIMDSYSGSPMWNSTYIAAYKQIVGRFTDVIKAQIFGHVHSVEFRLPLASNQFATQTQTQQTAPALAAGDTADLVPIFMVAAISPYFGNNPAFTVWDYDPETYDLLDFTIYATNISDDSQELDWRPLFSASKAFGVMSLSTPELSGFADRAAKDPELVAKYYHNSKARAESYVQDSCLNAECQAQWLCTMQWWDTAEDYSTCVAATQEQLSVASGSLDTITATAVSSSASSYLIMSLAILAGGVVVAVSAVLIASRMRGHSGGAGSGQLLNDRQARYSFVP